ncbi:MAG: DUF3343 domain-containing protein [Deltaproteobacteria bacterium]|jgi:hypothetical protein|nr:DUF3343 domain-containing protein [Deltaproteobacteria bacterium]
MTEAIITFHSTAASIEAEDLLLSAQVAVRVMGRPNELGTDCGFCLKINLDDLTKALEIIKKANINIQKIYQVALGQDGKWQYKPIDDPIAQKEFSNSENSGKN